MYQKKYYSHKIIFLLVLFFKDPNILLFTLLFVYILSCFHPIVNLENDEVVMSCFRIVLGIVQR